MFWNCVQIKSVYLDKPTATKCIKTNEVFLARVGAWVKISHFAREFCGLEFPNDIATGILDDIHVPT